MKLQSTADGLKAKPVNPFKQYGDAMATEYMDFEANNPELPLTKQMPCNTVLEGVEVWQRNAGDEWFNSPERDYKNFETFENFSAFWSSTCNVRKAFQLVEAEKEKPNGVICGEGADIFFNYKQATPSSKGSEESVTKAAHEAVNPNSPTWQIELEYFEKGWNKATQQQGLVSLERVVELMENRIIRLQEIALSKLESETLINENEYMLIKLKTLKQ